MGNAKRGLHNQQRCQPLGRQQGACAYYGDKEAQGTYIVEIESGLLKRQTDEKTNEKTNHEPLYP